MLLSAEGNWYGQGAMTPGNNHGVTDQVYRLRVGSTALTDHTTVIASIQTGAGSGTLSSGVGGASMDNAGLGNTVVLFKNGPAGQESALASLYGECAF